MSEELQAEITRLREHNEKLLSEKKAAVAQVTALETERDKLTAHIQMRDEAPINDVFVELSDNERYAQYLRQEFEREFQIGADEEGRLEVRDLNGNPVELRGKPCAFNAGNIRSLANNQDYPMVAGLMKPLFNSGGGANGVNGGGRAAHLSDLPSEKKKESSTQTSQFGLR